MADQLSAEDWLHQGLKTLAKSGFTALKAEPLAKAMGVSRGSFYWHFADIGVYHAAILKHWRDVAAEQVIADLELVSKDRDAIALLLRQAFSGTPALENAVRNLGHRRSGGPRCGAGDRPATPRLHRDHVETGRIFRRCGPRPRADSLLGVSRFCAVGQTAAAGTAGGSA